MKDVSAVISQIVSWVTMAIGICILILIAGTVMRYMQIRLPLNLPSLGATELAWLCGAWWLYRGGKL
jgi:hypothetical protein